MLQIAFIRENQEKVVKALTKRNLDAADLIQRVIDLDETRRSTQVELDNILAESNKLSKDIGALMKAGEKAKADILKQKTVDFKEKSNELAEVLKSVTEDLTQELYKIPNTPADIVPEGKSADDNLNVFKNVSLKSVIVPSSLTTKKLSDILSTILCIAIGVTLKNLNLNIANA